MARTRRKARSFESLLSELKAIHHGQLFPPLAGFVYRFAIYLPLLSEGREVFSSRQRALLSDLFLDCFAGFSENASEGHPPWYGSWSPLGADRPIVDRHTLIVLYSPQTEQAKDFFRRLRWILEQDEQANQDVVLIEHVAAWLVEAAAMSDQRPGK